LTTNRDCTTNRENGRRERGLHGEDRQAKDHLLVQPEARARPLQQEDESSTNSNVRGRADEGVCNDESVESRSLRERRDRVRLSKVYDTDRELADNQRAEDGDYSYFPFA